MEEGECKRSGEEEEGRDGTVVLWLGEGGVVGVEEGRGVIAEEEVVWVVVIRWVRRVVRLAATRGRKQRTREKDS